MKRGTQIAYIPNHADGNIDHPDVEFGFVMSDNGRGCCFCRYWSRNDPDRLRTTACSEGTPVSNLIEFDSVPQKIVTKMIAQIEGDDG